MISRIAGGLQERLETGRFDGMHRSGLIEGIRDKFRFIGDYDTAEPDRFAAQAGTGGPRIASPFTETVR